jgi:hypothetical protein
MEIDWKLSRNGANCQRIRSSSVSSNKRKLRTCHTPWGALALQLLPIALFLLTPTALGLQQAMPSHLKSRHTTYLYHDQALHKLQQQQWRNPKISSTVHSRQQRGRIYIWLSTMNNYQAPKLAAGAPDYFGLSSLSDNNEDDITNGSSIPNVLSYLPDSGNYLPPRTRTLLYRATEAYCVSGIRSSMEQQQQQDNRTQPPSRADIGKVLQREYRTRDVPVRIGQRIIPTLKSGGTEAEQFLAQTLSFCALCQLPMPVALFLVRLVVPDNNNNNNNNSDNPENETEHLQAFVDEFASLGWEAVTFLNGLALRLQPEFRSSSLSLSSSPGALKSLFLAKRIRISEAQLAVSMASAAVAPVRRNKQSRLEFLAKMEEQLTESTPTTAVRRARQTYGNGSGGGSSGGGMLFFPNSVKLQDGGAAASSKWSRPLQWFQQTSKRQVDFLKENGRTGLVAYCLLNFLFYSTGMLWQWRRIDPADPLTTSSTVAMVILRKFGRVFGSLYVASQVLKIPKLFAAVGLLPLSRRLLGYASRKLDVSENTASVILVGLLYTTWVGVVAVPALGDFAKLRRLICIDERLLQVYGLQPV